MKMSSSLILAPWSVWSITDDGLGWHLRQDILAIRTVVLRDACIIGFKLQHPFGGVNGIVFFDRIFSEPC